MSTGFGAGGAVELDTGSVPSLTGVWLRSGVLIRELVGVSVGVTEGYSISVAAKFEVKE